MRLTTARAQDGRGDGERGAALLAVLWFVAAVAGLAVGFSGLARGDWQLAAAQVDAVRARALAREAIARTAVALEARRGRPLPRGYRWELDGGVVAVRVEPETGKVDLNAADPAMLEALARTVGVPQDASRAIAAAITDWRDENDRRQVGGAEDRDYDSADRGYSASDRPFRHVSELRYVLPVDTAVYGKLAPHLTVYTGKAEPDRRAASKIVRAAMRLKRGIKPSAGERDGDGDEAASGGGGSRYSSRTPVPSVDGAGPPGGPSQTPQPTTGEGGGTAEGGGGAGGGSAANAYGLLLDVRLPGGYEAHARAVVAPAAGRSGQALRSLEWEQAIPVAPVGAGF